MVTLDHWNSSPIDPSDICFLNFVFLQSLGCLRSKCWWSPPEILLHVGPNERFP